MGIAAIFSSFFCITLFFFSISKVQSYLGKILLYIYLGVSLFGIAYTFLYPDEYKLQLWPYLYLILILILFFRPFLFYNTNGLIEGYTFHTDNKIKILIYLYILAAIFVMSVSLQKTIQIILNNEWLSLRNQFYQNEVDLYDSQLERFAKIYLRYFRVFAIIIYFSYVIYVKDKLLFKTLLVVAIVAPSIITAISIASRGSLVKLIVELVAAYFIFRDQLPKRINRRIRLLFIIFLSLYILYSSIVSLGRFGSDGQYDSIFFYFSHSFLTFNYGVADSIANFADGQYLFKWLFELSGNAVEITDASLGTHFGSSFMTFVGTLYIDFGPVGTLIIALIIPVIIIRLLSVKKVGIPELFITIFYFSYLANGVFVVGYSDSLSWIITFAIYIFLKIKLVKLK